jgi:hypothetical protein
MGKYAQTVTVACANCHDDFTLTARGYDRRVERYGERILCQRCLGDVWLRTRGKRADRYLLETDTAAAESMVDSR